MTAASSASANSNPLPLPPPPPVAQPQHQYGLQSAANHTIIDGCLSAAVTGLEFSVGELWRREPATKDGKRANLLKGGKDDPHAFTCLHIVTNAREHLSEGMMVGKMDLDTSKHPLSAQVCYGCMDGWM